MRRRARSRHSISWLRRRKREMQLSLYWRNRFRLAPQTTSIGFCAISTGEPRAHRHPTPGEIHENRLAQTTMRESRTFPARALLARQALRRRSFSIVLSLNTHQRPSRRTLPRRLKQRLSFARAAKWAPSTSLDGRVSDWINPPSTRFANSSSSLQHATASPSAFARLFATTFAASASLKKSLINPAKPQT